ncbi:flagellar M-ring protein FliF [Thioclava sp. BHET1]|nr:flagellar M-ring protein FliF [Thioclava sp. BHET1]
MTLKDVRAFGLGLIDRLKKLPLAVTLGAGVIVLAVAVMAAIGFSSERYAVLFDGLSPARGGKVIAALQKEGIPFRLSHDGNIISVPDSDLGRARLQLGVEGQPQVGSDAGWKALEGASVTTSEAATSALKLQATESSLQESITALSGAAGVQVLLAMPKDTPFLADQAKPKASVILTGAPAADRSLGVAISKVVAGAVPGLDAANVVVATSKGAILYPVDESGNVAEQLAVVSRVEAAQEAKIRSLLVPILGAGNSRVSVSADVDFSDKTINSVTYGPKSFRLSATQQSKVQYGPDGRPEGIPGALSNQPPGPTTAPVRATSSGKSATPPRSDEKQSQTSFAVDKAQAREHPAPWRVRKLNATVVVNKAALGSMTTARLQAMIGATIAVPIGKVDVTSSDFVTSSTALAGSPAAQVTRLIQAGLVLLAALGFLFGAVRPMIAALRQLAARPVPSPAPAARTPAAAPFEEDLKAANLRHIAGQVAEIGQQRPEEMAAVLKKWLAGDGPDITTEGVT